MLKWLSNYTTCCHWLCMHVCVCRTVKHTWSELGRQLSTLASLHADKANAYMNEVRQPLLDLAPQLEDTRKEVLQQHVSCGSL